MTFNFVINKDHMIPINMKIFVTYKRCLCLNSQSKGQRAARGSDILRGDAKEYSGRRLRLWRGGCVYHVTKILGVTEER